jgi:hypothetical protein
MTRSNCRINSPILAGTHALCTYARATRTRARKRKDRAPVETKDKARVSGETVRKNARTHPYPSCIGAQTYSSETHSEGSHVCRHQQGVDPCRTRTSFPAAKRGLGWRLSKCVQFMPISTVPTDVDWVVRGPYEGTALLGLGSPHGKTPHKS